MGRAHLLLPPEIYPNASSSREITHFYCMIPRHGKQGKEEHTMEFHRTGQNIPEPRRGKMETGGKPENILYDK